ncbi:MAG: alpha/beta fold hydrolase [Myxococcaceae bacterium]
MAGWIAAVSHWFRLKVEPSEKLHVVTSDGWRLAVHHRKAKVRKFREPVLLCHGLSANHHNLDFEPPYSLAHALNDAGFDTYAVDFRGTHESSRPPSGKSVGDYSVDDHIQKDGPALVQFALEHSGASQVFWVGHSLGGLIGYGVAGGASAEKLRGLVTLGSPVFFVFDRNLIRHAIRLGLVLAWPHKFRQGWFSRAAAPFLGHVALPLSDTIINPRHIAPHIQRKAFATIISAMGRNVLLQFRDWIWSDSFRSRDGKVDYRAGVERMTVPLLVTAGSKDRLAAARGVQRAFDLAGSKDKTLLVFGRENGDEQDYGHGDLLFGTGAPKEVYPIVIRWLEARATGNHK